jgi:hypothetical protein
MGAATASDRAAVLFVGACDCAVICVGRIWHFEIDQSAHAELRPEYKPFLRRPPLN